MIEFNGEQSNECKLLIAREKSKKIGLLFTIINSIADIFILVFGILNNKLFISLLTAIIFLLLAVLTFITPKKQVSNVKIDTKIVITSDTILMDYSTNFYANKKTLTRKISNIKKIIDFGICYCIIFKHGDITNSWICEKSLITKGSISNFEELFCKQIIKSNKKLR